MTNMEGVGLLFLAFFIGIPILIVAIIFGYFVHRNRVEKSRGQIESQHPAAYANYIDAFIDFMIHPYLFFKRISEGPVSLYQPFILVTLGGIFFTFSYIVVSMGGGIVNIAFLTLAGGIILLLFCYIFWIVATLALYTITAVFKGTGPMIMTAQNIGFAEAFDLAAFGILVLFLGVIASLFRVSFLEYGPPMGSNPFFAMIVIGSALLISVWTACLTIFGLQYSRNLPFQKAAISVAVPLGFT